MLSELKVLDLRAQLQGSGSICQTGCDPGGRCGNGLEKIYPTCAVRYGHMRYIGEFRYAPDMKFACGGKVVIQSNRGIEIGEQVSLTCSGCEKSISRKQIMDYVRASGNDFFELKAGRILRAATPQDLDEQMHLNQDAARKLRRARELATEMGLNMRFVVCEHLLGGERLVFHFMSEERVDFRELVKQLAHEYHTRIEMHQVGARDEARLVADYEICGRECCCKNFLKKLRPVNMKMAKLQKATLDPSKVSGRCGRLRCCLRYEHEGYEELNKKLPRTGARIRTERGIGTVIDRQILTQLLSVQYDDSNDLETVPVESVLERGLPPRPPMPPPQEREMSERGGDRGPRRDRNGGRDRGGPPRGDRRFGPGGGPASEAGRGPANAGRPRPRRDEPMHASGPAPDEVPPVDAPAGTAPAFDSSAVSETQRAAQGDVEGAHAAAGGENDGFAGGIEIGQLGEATDPAAAAIGDEDGPETEGERGGETGESAPGDAAGGPGQGPRRRRRRRRRGHGGRGPGGGDDAPRNDAPPEGA